MDFSEHRARLSILAVAALLVITFAVRDAGMASDSVNLDDLLFIFAIYAIPFLVFAFMVWTGRWSDLRARNAGATVREKIAVAAEISGTIASGMFLFTLPLWIWLASHEFFGSTWMIAGALTSMLAIVCAVAGSPRLWRHAIASGLLIPFWVTLAGLLAKAMMD
jgi:hypothetical protein